MARRAFCVPALVTAFISIVLLVLTTVSVPTTYHKDTPFDIVRAKNVNGANTIMNNNNNVAFDQARFGIWGYCVEEVGSDDFKQCTNPLDHMYTAVFSSTQSSNNEQGKTSSIKSSYTRGLVIAPVALVASVVAFILSFIPSLALELVASLVYLVTCLITLAAFIVQIVFYIYVRVQIHKVSPNASIMPGPAFYFTLISVPLLFFSALTVCCGYHKGRKENYSDSSSDKKFLRSSA